MPESSNYYQLGGTLGIITTFIVFLGALFYELHTKQPSVKIFDQYNFHYGDVLIILLILSFIALFFYLYLLWRLVKQSA